MPGVYISYPFCAQKCTYCNFASGVFPREIEPRYVAALEQEIRAAEWGFTPDTVYFGGGTPSQMEPHSLARLLSLVPYNRTASNEISLEAAPGGITRDLAAEWHKAGINRVSLGVQSFIKSELARTGRKHTAEVVAQEVAILRNAGITNFNIDLIAGLPGQTAASWAESLDWIQTLGAPHVSVYMLEVDEDSRLGAEVIAFGQRYGARDIPSEDAIADFYESAVERLADLGIPRYEISNFARPGFESRHNIKYWTREPYAGFGADAHSFNGRDRLQNSERVEEYISQLHRGAPPVRTAADPISERFFLGLRMMRGVAPPFEPFAREIDDLMSRGLLELTDRLRLTPRGVLLSNEVFAEFV